MEAIGALLGIVAILLVLAMPVMIIVALVKLGRLQDQMQEVRERLGWLVKGQTSSAKAEVPALPVAPPQPVETPKPAETPKAAVTPKPQTANAELRKPEAQVQKPETSVANVECRAPNVAEAKVDDGKTLDVKRETSERRETADARPVQNQLYAPVPPTALEIFWQKIEDWLAVKGDFAPKGVTHEFAFATSWLVRVGVALVAASIVYFVKLSIDRGWMGPVGRVAATVFWGAIGSVAGAYLVKKTRYGVIGHAVAALGIVALYVGFGLGHRFFDPPVIPSATLAFAALFGVTLYAGIAAVFMPSAFIAVMAIIGGYAVPVIAGRDTGSPMALCAYLLIIDAMAFFVARFRKWSVLDFLSATLAYLTMFVWCGMHSRLDTLQALTVFAFFTLVHAVYMVGVVVDSGKRSKSGNAMALAGLVLNACTYLAYLATHFRAGFSSELTGLVFLALVAAYLAVAAWGKRNGTLDRTTVDIVLVFAIAFLAIAPMLLFGSPWWTVSWCAIAVAASEAEKRTGQRILGTLSLVVFGAAALYGLFRLMPLHYGFYIANNGGFGMGVPASDGAYWQALLLRSVRLWSLPVAAMFIGRNTRKELRCAALAIGFLLYTLEAHVFGMTFIAERGGGAVTMAWFLLAFGTVWAGIVRRIRVMRICALVLFGVSVAKLLLVDTAHLPTPLRVFVFALCGVLLIVGAFIYIKFRERFTENEEDNRK